MSGTVRAFVAIELPDEIRSALSDLIEDLRRSNIRSMRLVRAEGIHLTLKFLGEIDRGQVDSVVAAVSGVARAHRAFTLELGGVGAFPRRDSPRVLWVGMGGQLAPLLDLQRDVEGAVAPLGFSRETREFSPHLTVARLRDGTSMADKQKAAQTLFSARIESGLPVDVDSLSLVQSRLLPEGAVYECLARMPLGKRFS